MKKLFKSDWLWIALMLVAMASLAITIVMRSYGNDLNGASIGIAMYSAFAFIIFGIILIVKNI